MTTIFITLRTALAATILAAAFTACGGGGGSSPSGGGTPATPTPQATVVDVVPPAGTIYLGAFSNPDQQKPPPIANLEAFEAEIGRKVAITVHYYGFYDTFPGPYEADDLAHGRMPVDSWDCQVPNAAIAAGNYDNFIRQRADALKAYGKPIMLRYMWEMNLPANAYFRHICYDPATDEPNGIFSAANFIAAWDRMRSIFLSEGATNVVWLWNPSGSSDPLSFYPGASETDWVGFDKYDDTSTPFAQTYAQAYGWLAPLGKPILIGETGVQAAIQPQYFAAAVPALKNGNSSQNIPAFPLIKGLIYFNSAGATSNWVISPDGLSAFRAMAEDPYFSAKAP